MIWEDLHLQDDGLFGGFVDKGVSSPVARDALRLGLYTGMGHSEVLELGWDREDLDAITLTVEETKSGELLEIPIVRQVAAILERRMTERGKFPERSRVGVFPSETIILHKCSAYTRQRRRNLLRYRILWKRTLEVGSKFNREVELPNMLPYAG